MQCRRDGEGRQRTIEHIAVRLLAEYVAFQNAFGQFLDKQGHAVRAVDDLGDDLLGERLAAGDPCDQSRPIAPVEAIERQHRHPGLAGPGRLELRAVGSR